MRNLECSKLVLKFALIGIIACIGCINDAQPEQRASFIAVATQNIPLTTPNAIYVDMGKKVRKEIRSSVYSDQSTDWWKNKEFTHLINEAVYSQPNYIGLANIKLFYDRNNGAYIIEGNPIIRR